MALDPLGKYAASLSSDRSCRIYAYKPPTKVKSSEKMNYVCQHVVTKAENISVDDSKVEDVKSIVVQAFSMLMFPLLIVIYAPTLQSVKNHLFHDETLPSFFRRLAWSPDGSFLLVPAGNGWGRCRLLFTTYPRCLGKFSF